MNKLLSLLIGLLFVFIGYSQDEIMPQYPGGIEGISKHMKDHIIYPESAINNAISGTVIVSFVVTKTGEMDSIFVAKGIGYGCDQEAIRVVHLMKNWSPGIQKGEKVNVKMFLPIRFILDGGRKKRKKKKPK